MHPQSHMNAFNSQQQVFPEMTLSQKTSSESDMGRNVIAISDSTGNDVMEAPPSGDNQDRSRKTKRVRYNRHTQYQIQEMENLFNKCPHPDEQQRRALGSWLGLDPLQVKFWFQNKRTQVKAQLERSETAVLRQENERLRADNEKYKEALSNSTCVNCGGPTVNVAEMSTDEQHLMMDNLRLRDEIENMNTKLGENPSNADNMPTENNMDSPPLDLGVGNDFEAQPLTDGDIYCVGSDEAFDLSALQLSSVPEKLMITELAVAAMEELMMLALSGEHMWVPGKYGMEILNEDEYSRVFPRGFVPNAIGLEPETSRQSAVIIMNRVKLVEILMDVNQWSKIFCGIVTRATRNQVIAPAVAGNYDGAIQIMSAEFQVPSPFVPTRKNYFVRYCKKQSEDSWAIVDFSIDDIMTTPPGVMRSKRQPSGCIIQELPNGYSKVIWIEHAEVDCSGVHDLYKILVKSGLAFGAKRWVAVLDRQCERLASSMATKIPVADLSGVITSPAGRSNLLKLAGRMIRSFSDGVGAAAIHPWSPLTGCEDVRIMSRRTVDDPGRPDGIIISASTSLWLSLSPARVFDFLRAETSRNQWDILSCGGMVHELAHIANGRDHGNCVSLLSINGPSSVQTDMIILQESFTDVTGSYVVYAPIASDAMNSVLSGSDPDHVAILPSGFAILPDGPRMLPGGPMDGIGSGGSLVTIAFQILVNSSRRAKLTDASVNSVNNLLKRTVNCIKDAIMSDKAP